MNERERYRSNLNNKVEKRTSTTLGMTEPSIESQVQLFGVVPMYASRIKFIKDSPDESEKPAPAALSVLIAIGYTEAGTQVREAAESFSNSCKAVGRTELDPLQHNCNNSQMVSEKPRDSAWRGFSGRRPSKTTAVTGEKAHML